MNSVPEEVFVSTAYLPPIDYFVILQQAKNICLETQENYLKQTYRNRCRIAGPNGVQVLSIPVNKQGYTKVKIRDLKIAYNEPWQQIHWRSIETAYNTSAYFLYYRDDLQPFYQKQFTWLFDYNLHLLELIIKWLKMSPLLKLTQDYHSGIGELHDFRYNISPKESALFSLRPYYQVFNERHGFQQNLSIIDLVFNEGPESTAWLTI